ncbi:CDP-diacylglycerol--serine O-phosphatidyltransferase [Sphingobacterium cellulitidis]|nr:CDP-diacylglycerol--serine O-phosphatidyltransferase [Sphingobacterium cellulitidis]OYD47409.1 CDP-diacylglycerol--serine O-phosphatidyltransferase [Sphingobacterium cellulitidis]
MAFFMKKYIPNTITSLNLFSGCIGVVMVLNQEYLLAFYCVLASGIFDFFDGMSARALHVKSLIGKELDSLADVISFGFLPGAIIFTLLKDISTSPYLPYLGFIITVFSALRLAKFNIDTRQTTDFIGVNTPMNTFFIVSLPFILLDYPMLKNAWLLLGIAIVSSLLLVSEIKLFSMKLSTLSWAVNKYKYLFLLTSIILLITLKFLALPIILVLYIIFSKLHFAFEKTEVNQA